MPAPLDGNVRVGCLFVPLYTARAGTPTTLAPAGTGPITQAPAPTTASSPMVRGLRSVPLMTQAPAPIRTLCPILTCPQMLAPGDPQVKAPISTSWDIELFTFTCTCSPCLTLTGTVAPGSTITSPPRCPRGTRCAR